MPLAVLSYDESSTCQRSATCFLGRVTVRLMKGVVMKTSRALVGVGLFAAVMACNRNEPNYEGMANDALDKANLSAVDADYDATDPVVHVKRTVTSETDRQRAGDVVQAVLNNQAQVANEVTVEGGHEQTADDFDGAIETRLNNRVDLDAALKDQDITFDANNGIVTITGRVPTAGAKDKVGQMVKDESGVRDVVNALEVGPKS